MKHLLFVFATILLSVKVVSQDLRNIAFNTNGPMGECLFPQNEDGDISFSEIIECGISKDSIFLYAKEWIHNLEEENIDIDDLFEGINKISFKCEIPVGKEMIQIGPALIPRKKSAVNFNCLLEIKDNKFRYTLNHFYTNRRNIPGEAKSEGPSNMIHWQRVNSLRKEQERCRKEKDKREKQAYIEDEQWLYKMEYALVQHFITQLKRMATLEDFDF